MRKLALFVGASGVLVSTPIISSERDFVLSNQNHYQMTSFVYDGYYTHIPQNPNVFEDIKTYKDMNLTQVSGKLTPNKPFEIINLLVNDNLQPIFQLADETYVLASGQDIFDDMILEHSYSEELFWLNPGVTVMTSPIGNQTKKASKQAEAYKLVTVTERVLTPRGEFVKIAEGWLPSDSLSLEDNRINQVQDMLNQKYQDSDYSIYVHQLDTGFTAGINDDKMMYSASIGKLPVLYYAQLGLERGNLSLKDQFSYVDKINDFEGSYLPDGSGSLPKKADNNSYDLGQLIRLTSQKSDNVASNLLGFYLTNQFDKTYYSQLDPITQKTWDMSEKEASARMAGLVMAALYDLNPSGFVLETLSQTDFDKERISKNIDVKVAHKIGDAYDFRHDVAVIYTDSPYVLAVFTHNKTYSDITAIADDVYRILK